MLLGVSHPITTQQMTHGLIPAPMNLHNTSLGTSKLQIIHLKTINKLCYCTVCPVNISIYAAIIPYMLRTAGMVFMTPWFGGTILVGQSGRWISFKMSCCLLENSNVLLCGHHLP